MSSWQVPSNHECWNNSSASAINYPTAAVQNQQINWDSTSSTTANYNSYCYNDATNYHQYHQNSYYNNEFNWNSEAMNADISWTCNDDG